MKTTAKNLAPRGTTLKLSDGIEISTKARPRSRRVSAVEVYVGPTGVSYSVAQEFGTVNHSANPFMRPAWDSSKYQVLWKFADDLWDEIYKSIQRQERKIAREAAKLKAGQ